MNRLAIIIYLFGTVFCCRATGLSAQEKLTLEACREKAIQNNKELRISTARQRIAADEQKRAFTKYFPEISATGAYLWNQKDLQLVDPAALGAAATLLPNLADIFHLDIRNIWIGGINLVQPVFMGGQIVDANRLAAYAKELAAAQHDTQLQEVIYATDQAYWQVVSLVNKKKLADAYVQLLQKMQGDMDAMIAEGVATQADGLSVRVKLNEAQTAQTKVENGLSLSRMALAQVCGMPLDTLFTLADEQLDSLPEANSPLFFPPGTFLNRPELRSLELAARIYKKKEDMELGKLLPSVAFGASYLITNPNLDNGYKTKFSGMFHLGVLLSVPLSGWWEGAYKRNAARAQTLIARLEYENARDKIALQARQSSYQLEEAGKRLKAADRNMESAEENLQHAEAGFTEGVIPALNLMEAQTAWVGASSERIDAQIGLRLAKVYLAKAMGQLGVDK
ncbi:MAG: TolC family protein [Tannerella sp.]|jgi:outer membrane protein TolC|nr:TolC family protein [Tannerella sp.]